MTSYESYRLRRLLARTPSARVNCMTDAPRGPRLGTIGGGSTFKAQTSLLKPFLYTTKNILYGNSHSRSRITQGHQMCFGPGKD